MFKPYPLFIGLRYAGARQRSQLVSFISLVSMLGMTLGVALLIVVLSVMNGFDREMRTRILGHSYSSPWPKRGQSFIGTFHERTKVVDSLPADTSGIARCRRYLTP